MEVEGDSVLRLSFADGERMRVDLAARLRTQEVLRPLRSPPVFRTAKLGPHGAWVEWTQDDRLTLGADNLRAWAVEQSGEVPHEFLWAWMHRNGLDVEAAAAALGLTRSDVTKHRSGQRPLPRWLVLACLGWEALRGVALHTPNGPWRA